MYHKNNSKFVEVHFPYLSHYILNKPLFFLKNIENLSVKKIQSTVIEKNIWPRPIKLFIKISSWQSNDLFIGLTCDQYLPNRSSDERSLGAFGSFEKRSVLVNTYLSETGSKYTTLHPSDLVEINCDFVCVGLPIRVSI